VLCDVLWNTSSLGQPVIDGLISAALEVSRIGPKVHRIHVNIAVFLGLGDTIRSNPLKRKRPTLSKDINDDEVPEDDSDSYASRPVQLFHMSQYRRKVYLASIPSEAPSRDW
jgi:hypothetical protein